MDSSGGVGDIDEGWTREKINRIKEGSAKTLVAWLPPGYSDQNNFQCVVVVRKL